jgi:imidazolonepropionase
LGLSIEEAINAMTINSAYAAGLEAQAGSLDPGKALDLLLLDAPDYAYLAYHPGRNPVHTVIKAGRIVVQAGCRVRTDHQEGS